MSLFSLIRCCWGSKSKAAGAASQPRLSDFSLPAQWINFCCWQKGNRNVFQYLFLCINKRKGIWPKSWRTKSRQVHPPIEPPLQSLTRWLALKSCLGHIMTPLLVFKVTGRHASASYIRKCSMSQEWNIWLLAGAVAATRKSREAPEGQAGSRRRAASQQIEPPGSGAAFLPFSARGCLPPRLSYRVPTAPLPLSSWLWAVIQKKRPPLSQVPSTKMCCHLIRYCCSCRKAD